MTFRNSKIPRYRLLEPKPKANRSWLRWLAIVFVSLVLLAFVAEQSRAEVPALVKKGSDESRPTAQEHQYNWQRGTKVESGQLLFRRKDGKEAPALHLGSDYRLHINGMVAQITLRQTFRNQGDEWLEAIYLLPLQSESAVNAMKMEIGDRVIQGRIEEKKKAQKQYQKAKREGKRAAITSQHRPNMFSQKVANIGPGETVLVELSIVQPVQLNALGASTRQYEFSLRLPSTITPRYIPGKPLKDSAEISLNSVGWGVPTDQVSDAQHITPPMQSMLPKSAEENFVLNPMSLSVTLDAGLPLADIHSDFHDVLVKKQGQQHQVQLAKGVEPMDRDFVLRWQPAAQQQAVAALFRQTKEQEDYAMLMVMPPELSTIDLTREIIFIIDTSGSMDGESIRQAKAGLLLALTHLENGNAFNIIEFNSSFSVFSSQSVVMDNTSREKALSFVRNLHSGGGTEMLPALQFALGAEALPGLVKQVVFITDGSVGNEAALFQEINRLLGDARLFTVGIGSAPNGFFMRKAAQFGRGSYSFIGDTSQVAKVMGELFQRLEHPVMSNVKVQWPAQLNVEALPENIPDLYLGEPIKVLAKLSEKNASEPLRGEIIVSGEVAGQAWQQVIHLAGGKQAEHKGIASLWGREKISSLLDEIVLGQQEAIIKPQVLKLALDNQLLSPYTSFVAIEQTPSRPKDKAVTAKPVKNVTPKGQAAVAYPKTAAGLWANIQLSALLFLLAAMYWFSPRLLPKIARWEYEKS